MIWPWLWLRTAQLAIIIQFCEGPAAVPTDCKATLNSNWQAQAVGA